MKLATTYVLSALFLCGVVHSHPHVFVNAQAGFQVDSKQHLHALRISWRYDAFTTLFLFEALDLDSDSDGQLNQSDREAIAVAETNWPREYNGDVHLSIAGKAQTMSSPINATADMVGGEIIVSFDLPLATPAKLSGRSASLRLFDPVYYYDYSVTVDSDKQHLPEGCKATAIAFEPDEAEAEMLWALATLSREETPSEPNIGARFADEVTLSCR